MATTLGNVTQVPSGYAEIAQRPLDAERCALVIIDIQEKLLPPIYQKERMVKNSQLLIRLAGILKLPTLMTTQYAKGLGSTVPEIANLLPTTEAIDKQMFSCLMQTALSALREGYLVHVASDAVSSRSESNWKVGLERMRDAGAIISSTEMMLYELLRSSGAPAFKELLPYLKD